MKTKTKRHMPCPPEKKCRHFNGVQHQKCKADVDYQIFRDLPESKTGTGICLPCLGKQGVSCPKFEAWTKEELDAQYKAIQNHFKGFSLARPTVVEESKRLGFIMPNDGNEGGKGVSGKIPCPVCEKGELHFSRSGYNGHIHAKCTTENCMFWME